MTGSYLRRLNPTCVQCMLCVQLRAQPVHVCVSDSDNRRVLLHACSPFGHKAHQSPHLKTIIPDTDPLAFLVVAVSQGPHARRLGTFRAIDVSDAAAIALGTTVNPLLPHYCRIIAAYLRVTFTKARHT